MEEEKKLDKNRKRQKGSLKIGDSWNAITIIALSQNSPLKAIAEFVENSIDAGAKEIHIVRGKDKGKAYLKITDNGAGLPLNEEGLPDFKYVATHICDSIKRKLKKQGAKGLQGEFGIGLLSFWTVGEKLFLSSCGKDGRSYQMVLRRENQGYEISEKHSLIKSRQTELLIAPLLPGIRQVTGEKIQNYLAAELRDRIKKSEVRINIIDRQARKTFSVEPRKFEGTLLHQLPVASSLHGETYYELYLCQPLPENRPGLCRSGTRVLQSITQLDRFNIEPWNSGYLQGIVDVPFLQLTPGTRDGVIQDKLYEDFCVSIEPVERALNELISAQRKAEDEKASSNTLKSIQKALKEALVMLPEEYDWFGLRNQNRDSTKSGIDANIEENAYFTEDSTGENNMSKGQKKFFECPGPLSKVIVTPASCVLSISTEKNFRAIAKDNKGRVVDGELKYKWKIISGFGRMDSSDIEIARYYSAAEPGLVTIGVEIEQGGVIKTGEALITVTAALEEQTGVKDAFKKGLPGYTFQHAPGELWRSQFNDGNNVIIINSGHRDFVFASKNHSRKLRYICRLFTKELIIQNFAGLSSDSMLERLIELSLYTEENL